MLALIAHIDWFWYLVVVSISVLVFLMAQHNKNNVKLEPEEIERLLAVLNDSQASIKDKNQAAKKLKAHQKALKERPSRQSREKRKSKKTK